MKLDLDDDAYLEYTRWRYQRGSAVLDDRFISEVQNYSSITAEGPRSLPCRLCKYYADHHTVRQKA